MKKIFVLLALVAALAIPGVESASAEVIGGDSGDWYCYVKAVSWDTHYLRYGEFCTNGQREYLVRWL